MLSTIEQTRLRLSKNTEAKKKSQLGQFLTSARTAAFMASLFPDGKGRCRLLDAGAGIGSLSAAFLDRWDSAGFGFQCVELDAFEIDDSLYSYLNQTLEKYKKNSKFIPTIRNVDFIHAAADWLSGSFFAEEFQKYTHAILNPPYKKINSSSSHRLALRRVGIETVNLYSAFVALAVALAAPGGQIVAIIPRSFCNGPYYRPFRDFILEHTAIRHLHLFELRNKAFKEDKVLQENIIIRLERSGQQSSVTISTSADDTFTNLKTHKYPFDQIVFPEDSERFIRVPLSSKSNIKPALTSRYTLTDLGINVSTGPVVDFRLKEHLRDMPEAGTVPLLYPCHFSGISTKWPVTDKKKSNAILCNDDTERWLCPSGFYCVVRRFTAKEERRRIVASVVDPDALDNAPMLGIENHLNFFHENKGGLSQALAHGLAVFLNSTTIDEYYRCFGGHTQVNATDLKLMKYPSRGALIEVGKWAMQQGQLSQTMIDTKLETLAE